MMKVKVDIERGEATRVSPIAFQAIAGSWKRSLVAAAVGMAIGLLIAPTLAATIIFLVLLAAGPDAASLSQVHHERFTATLEIAAALLGWKLGEMHFWKRHMDRFVRGLGDRGSPERLATTFAIEPEGFRVESERGTMLARWASVVEIWRVASHWLIQADSLTLAVPRHAFLTAEEEREFVAKLAGYLTDAARRRSSPALSDIGVAEVS